MNKSKTIKKKIKEIKKDLTIEICNDNHCFWADYPHCPLEQICGSFGCITDKDLEKEVKIKGDK